MLDKKRIRLAILNGQENEIYQQLVNELISERYSIQQELSVQRQKDKKPNEFKEYDDYAESCKEHAKYILNEIKSEL